MVGTRTNCRFGTRQPVGFSASWKQEDIRNMFGWRSKAAELEEARLRQAFRKRLAEVLGLPDEDADPTAMPQVRFETALETNAGPQLSRTC